MHALILIALSWRSAGRLTAQVADRLCAVYILVWSNLVYTSLCLAAFVQLNQVALYFWTSVALAGGLDAWLRYRQVLPGKLPPVKRSAAPENRFDLVVRIGLAASLGLAVLATAVICLAYLPNNWDTCTYRISRAFFYLAKGSLLHAGNPVDPRLSFYPFNAALSYLFLAMYQVGPHYFNLVPALAWTFAGVGSYALARRIGASATGGLVAAWLCMLAPAVLVEAASGNDEVIAAAPILAGLIFALNWISTGQLRFLLLSSVGAGLGLGTKLHWAFYSLFIASVMVLWIFRAIRQPDFRSYWWKRLPAALGAAILAAPLAASFFLCNYLSVGELTPERFDNQVLNKPFRLSLALEKLVSSNSELFLSPIPDLVPPVRPEQRKPAYAAFNQFFMKCCFGGLKEVTRPTVEGYVFRGPTAEYAERPAETRVWLGFFPHLLLLVCLVYFITRKLPLACLVCAVAFFFWHTTYEVQMRYGMGAAAYYSFPAVLAAGGLGPVWDFARARRSVAAMLVLAAFLAVFATHALLACNLLLFGDLRNVQFVWKNHGQAPDLHPVDASVADAIRAARQVYIPGTHWEILYWNFMRSNPAAAYTTGIPDNLAPPDTLTLLSISPDVATGRFPVRVPSTTFPSFIYLGNADSLPVLARGNRIEMQFPGRAHYNLLQVSWRFDPATGNRSGAHTVKCCFGLTQSAPLAVRYDFRVKTTGLHLTSPWLSVGQAYHPPPGPANESFDSFTVEARDPRRPDVVTRTSYDIDSASFIFVGEETPDSAQDVALDIEMPRLAPELADYNGRRYHVSWLPLRTSFSVINHGQMAEAIIEMQLATSDKPRTAVLRADGRVLAPKIPVTKVFWSRGAETVRYRVKLQHGENKFELDSLEPPLVLSDGRQVCFLLIESIHVTLQ